MISWANHASKSGNQSVKGLVLLQELDDGCILGHARVVNGTQSARTDKVHIDLATVNRALDLGHSASECLLKNNLVTANIRVLRLRSQQISNFDAVSCQPRTLTINWR